MCQLWGEVVVHPGPVMRELRRASEVSMAWKGSPERMDNDELVVAVAT